MRNLKTIFVFVIFFSGRRATDFIKKNEKVLTMHINKIIRQIENFLSSNEMNYSIENDLFNVTSEVASFKLKDFVRKFDETFEQIIELAKAKNDYFLQTLRFFFDKIDNIQARPISNTEMVKSVFRYLIFAQYKELKEIEGFQIKSQFDLYTKELEQRYISGKQNHFLLLFLKTQFFNHKNMFFKRYSELEYAFIKRDISMDSKDNGELRDSLLKIIEEEHKKLPVIKQLDNRIEIKEVHAELNENPYFNLFINEFLDFFEYFDSEKSRKNVDSDDMNYLFTDFYHLLNLIRAELNFPIGNPHKFVLDTLEGCLRFTDFGSTRIESDWLKKVCIYPHKVYANVYFLYKYYASVKPLNPIKMSYQNYRPRAMITNVKAFLYFSITRDETLKGITKDCFDDEIHRYQDFCSIFRLYTHFVVWMDSEKENEPKYPEVHDWIVKNTLMDEAVKANRHKIILLVAFESLYYYFGYNKDSYNRFTSLLLNPNPKDPSFLKGRMASDTPFMILALCQIKADDLIPFSEYLYKTYHSGISNIYESGISETIQNILNTKDHMIMGSEFLSFFTYNNYIISYHIRFFLLYASSSEQFAKIVDLAMVLDLHSYDIAQLSHPFMMPLYEKWTLEFSKIDSRIKRESGLVTFTKIDLKLEDMGKIKKNLLENLKKQYEFLADLENNRITHRNKAIYVSCTLKNYRTQLNCINIPDSKFKVEVSIKKIVTYIKIEKKSFSIDVIDLKQLKNQNPLDIRFFTGVSVPADEILNDQDKKFIIKILQNNNFEKLPDWDSLKLNVSTSLYRLLGKQLVGTNGKIKTITKQDLKTKMAWITKRTEIKNSIQTKISLNGNFKIRGVSNHGTKKIII